MASWLALDRGVKRMVQVNHRRSGKDLDTWNKMIFQAAHHAGIYYYVFPTFAQAKKVIWEGQDNDSRPFLDYIPKTLIEKMREDEMKIILKTINKGELATSIIQLVGSDNYDHLMGTNPRFLVFSEYALQNPKAWEFFKPILRANKGIALFNSTPRGKNHLYKLYNMAIEQVERFKNPEWWVERLTIENTYSVIDGKAVPVLTQKDMDQERSEGSPEEFIQQEYYCSFNSGNFGAYYADLIEKAEQESRIAFFPYNNSFPVYTFWDIGFTDGTAIWFAQNIKGKWIFIDYYCDHGKGLMHYIKRVKEMPYVYTAHVGPHDLKQTDYASGVTTWDAANRLGIRFDFAPQVSIQDGIDATRKLLTTACFDRMKCNDGQGPDNGIECLKSYHKKWNDGMKCFSNHPVHDFASEPADALRYAATYLIDKEFAGSRIITVQNDFNIWTN
jgi:phage terminase large subunit